MMRKMCLFRVFIDMRLELDAWLRESRLCLRAGAGGKFTQPSLPRSHTVSKRVGTFRKKLDVVGIN